MRIGINASFLRKPGTGIGQVTWHFLRILAELPASQDHEFFIYTENEVVKGPLPHDLVANFRYRARLPWWKRDDQIRKYLWETKTLPSLVRKDTCDVLLSLYQSATVLNGIPHVVLVHDLIPEIFPEYRQTLRKQFFWNQVKKGLAGARAYIAVSRHTKEDMVKYLHIEPSKIGVQKPSVDPLFEKEVCLPDKARVTMKYSLPEAFIYHGGGLEIRKNTELVLRAYKALTRIMPEKELPCLVISGTIHSEKNPLATPVKKLIRELELEDRVSLLGHVPLADLPVLYALATVFVYPSRYEGFGLPVLEAMKVGTPVITTRVASIPEVGGEAVLYTRLDDSDALACLMKKVVQDAGLRAELSLGEKKIAQGFNWISFTNGILSAIQKI